MVSVAARAKKEPGGEGGGAGSFLLDPRVTFSPCREQAELVMSFTKYNHSRDSTLLEKEVIF